MNVFIEYGINSEAYKFYDPNAKMIIESFDVNFYVNNYPFK